MAKKTRTASKKATRKAASKKKATARSSSASKPKAKAGARKTTSKKKAASTPRKAKTAAKTTPKKKTTKKTTKKAVAKKTSKKVAKKTTKTATKKVTKKAAKKTSKATAKKSATTKTAKKVAKKVAKTSPKKTTSKKASAKGGAKATESGKPNRKGITIVSDRPKKKSTPKKTVAKFPPTGDRLLGPGSPIRKPLIPSGPGRAADAERERSATTQTDKKAKTPFNKRELDRFKQILLEKRSELFGDMSQMESGALRSSSGGLSHTPQHFAEQGSDSYDQSLSLDLAAADRRLIVEIDAALQRIADKTFGICELTGKPIKKTRLEELPWARHSIEAARELERRSGFRA